ncbi:DMT family transporter [Mycolicibacterium pallens]
MPGLGRVRPMRMVFVALAWGSCFVLLEWGARGGSVLWFVTWRACIAGAVLLGLTLVRGRGVRPVTTSSWTLWMLIVALAVLNVVVSFAAMAGSLTGTTTGMAAVLANGQALLVVLPAWWLFGERPSVLELVAVAIGFGGLLLIAVPAGSGRGAWLALLAAGGVTAGALLARRLAGVDILALGAWQFLIGAAMLAGVATAIDGPPRANWSINFVVAVLVLAVGGTALPYVAWFAELRRAPITAVTSWTLLVPVVGVGMSVLILREPVTPEQFIGDATVVAALAIVARSGRQKQNDVTPPSAQ